MKQLVEYIKTMKQSSLLIILIIFFFSCNKKADVDIVEATIPDLKTEKADVAVKWADLTLYAIRFSAFNTPK